MLKPNRRSSFRSPFTCSVGANSAISSFASCTLLPRAVFGNIAFVPRSFTLGVYAGSHDDLDLSPPLPEIDSPFEAPTHKLVRCIYLMRRTSPVLLRMGQRIATIRADDRYREQNLQDTAIAPRTFA